MITHIYVLIQWDIRNIWYNGNALDLYTRKFVVYISTLTPVILIKFLVASFSPWRKIPRW
jgi:hypothetical protein